MNRSAEQFLLKVVQDNYESIAFNFNQTRQKPMKPMVHEIVKNINLSGASRVLDLGCGNGCFLPVLSLYHKDFFYLGVDASKSLVNFAREKQGDHFVVKNILEIDELKEANFDYIFSFAVFHHLPGERLRLEFLNKVYNKLNKNGQFIFSVWKMSSDKKTKRFNKDFKNKKYLFLKSFLSQIIHGRVIDKGDLIFPWRGKINKNNFKTRYYHDFSKKELMSLVAKTSFEMDKIYEDDFNYYLILNK